jgi:hypothetical protein
VSISEDASPRRSKIYREELINPRRESDFMFQHLFETSRRNGRSGDSGVASEYWQPVSTAHLSPEQLDRRVGDEAGSR